ncbi:TonB-dependent receptor [Novosphingobium sp. G106]|uniref:TonB-dependent receptor n=1 Tax=Novosphingobium sp. G106 TaxID=2849500 RepID=UPI0020C4A25D|nr:TonB-dependent receptor [Novosphingobium sp. G106]
MSYSFRRTAALLGISTLSLIAAAPALANETAETAADAATSADEADSGGRSEIIVTAGRREERLQDVPTAVTALSKDLFELNGVGRSANEVLNYIPNASAGTQQHGRPRWWIRGIGAGQQQLDLASPVGFYLDDVYISNASATGLPLFDIERVEVLRGPQGTLWGKNTTGGAVNVITKRPSLSSDQDNYVKLEYGSYDDKIAEGGLGVAIVPDTIAARFSFRLDHRGGRFDNLFTGDKSNSIDDDVFRGQILAKPSDNLTALLSFHYRKYDTDGTYWTTATYPPGSVLRAGYKPSTDTDTVNTNAGEWSRSNQVGGSLRFDLDLGGVTATSITGYERWTSRSIGDTDYTPLEISRSYTKARSRQWTQELRLTSPSENRLTWIAGLFYFKENIVSDAYTAKLPDGTVPAQPFPPAPFVAPAPAYSLTDYEHSAESGAAFASGTFHATDALKLTLGARFTRETKRLDFNRFNATTASFSNYVQWWNDFTGRFGGPGTFANDLSRTWDAFTYDITPSWQINHDNLLYVKFSHGVKSGGFNTAATLPIALTAVNPERLNAYEAGYKSTWFDGKLTLNATYFHYDYRDIQVNVVGPNPGAVGGATVSYLQNAAKGKADGAEFELDAQPIEHLSLNAAVGLLYTKFLQFQVNNGGANLAGNQFVRSPHLTLNAGAEYTVPLGDAGKIELAADARYTSLQYYYVTPQDTVNRYLLTQPGYTLANARITYTTANEKISASFFVNNLLDTTYRNHALPAFAAGSVFGDTVQYGDPRTWGGSLIVRF